MLSHIFGGLKLDLFIFSSLSAACGKQTAWTRAVGLLQTSLQEALGAVGMSGRSCGCYDWDMLASIPPTHFILGTALNRIQYTIIHTQSHTHIQYTHISSYIMMLHYILVISFLISP